MTGDRASRRGANAGRCELVAVLGSGSWGTAAAGLIASNVREVRLFARRAEVADAINATRHNPAHLASYVLPANVGATSSLEEALLGADAVVVAVPSAHLHGMARKVAPYIAPIVPVCLLTKGLDSSSGMPLSLVLARELWGAHVPGKACDGSLWGNVAVLSGPNHAEEIAEGMVSAAVVASGRPDVAVTFQRLFSSLDFRAYASSDVAGVSVCGAVKNVVAIAAGVAGGLGAGDNALAVLMTRGLAEMGRLVAACGGEPITCMGLAGMGDLVATCTSSHSRNRSFGTALAKGMPLAAYEAASGMVVEGAAAVPGVLALARAHDVETPITSAVNAILYGGVAVADVVASLLRRPPHEEFYGFAPGQRGGREAQSNAG